MLEKDYETTICNKGDIDERVFVNVDDSLLASGSLSGGSVNISGTKVFSYTMLCQFSFPIRQPCEFSAIVYHHPVHL